MITITTEKDDFTGLRKINSNFFGLSDFLTFSGPTEIYIDFLSKQNSGIKSDVIDAIDLMYIEHENGQGNIIIRVVSALGKYLRNSEWPHWDDNWPMIIDGERINISSSSTNSFETSYELKVYDLPVDVFNKICNAKEVKYSLRGRNSKVEGVFSNKHQEVFKAFEQYCFGDEMEAGKKINEINKDLPASREEENNIAISIKQLSPEEIEKHENKTVELIKEKKVSDAVKYYSANFGGSDEHSKLKIKELSEKNGHATIYNNYYNKKASKYLLIGVILIALTFICPSLIPSDVIGKRALIYPILFFIGLLIVIINIFRIVKKK
jgi:hypothetical protein